MENEIKIDLMKIEGIGKATVKKLREAVFTDEKLFSSTTEDLIKVKIDEPLARKIIKEIQEIQEIEKAKIGDENPELDETSDFDLTKQNPYLVAGFKASKHYTTDKNYVEENFKKYLETGE